LIIPNDDLATRHLHQLHERARSRGEAGASLCALIERSLGAPESFTAVCSRALFMELAREEGVRVPKTEFIADPDGLRSWSDRVGFPAVLKANGTSGGEGVRVVHTLHESQRAFRKLQAPPLLARAAKYALLDRDTTLIWPALLRRRYEVNVQAYVPGREATTLLTCWKGAVLAGLHFEVLNKVYSDGPATVIRLIENTEMARAAEKMAGRLKLSGLHGFDFMLHANSGDAYLIEINPRATQVGHLTLGPQRDLPSALYEALSGQNVPASPKLTENDTIALFPGEWNKNPHSSFLRSAYHDVPWESPALMRFCVRRHGNEKSWYSRQKRMQVFLGARVP